METDRKTKSVSNADSISTIACNALVPMTIPRPSLLKSESEDKPQSVVIQIENLTLHAGPTYPTNLILALPLTSNDRSSYSSTSSSSSKSSSKSEGSQTLLLTAANLAAFKFENTPHHEYAYDTESLASSTHFTLVNGMENSKHKKPVECYCEKHQLTILIGAMTGVLTATVCFCVYFVHAHARDQFQQS